MSQNVHVPPTSARLVLIGWLCSLAAILYLDRICMAQAIKPIEEELGLSKLEISYVSMAFTLAYGLFAMPVGRLADRIGSRSVLTGIVLAWSVFTALSGAAGGLLSLIAARFLFGATEAGAFPNAARIIVRWFPIGEQGRVQGVMLGAAQFGAVMAPTAAALLIDAVGWRWSLADFALVGIVWAVGFWFWFRDDPAAHPGVNAAELLLIRANTAPPAAAPGLVPWREILTNRGIVVLGLINVLGSFYTYFFYTWFPNYLANAHQLSNLETGKLASFVLSGSAVGVLVGGWLADRIPRWFGDPIGARQRLGVVCYLVSAGCLFAGVRCDDPLALATLWCASFFAMHLTMPSWWSIVIPQSGRHVGAIFGLANGIGVVGAMASQGCVGWFVDRQRSLGISGREQWDPLMTLYVGVLLLGTAAWGLYRYRPLRDDG